MPKAVKEKTRDMLLIARPFVVYPPVVAGLVVVALEQQRHGAATLVAAVVAGLVFWTLVEWVVHRAMHVRSRSKLIARIQDEAHLRHHRAPDDLPHSVVRLSASLPLAALLFGAAYALCQRLDVALFFHTGLITGYLTYETVHLLGHAGSTLPVLAALGRHHKSHHFATPRRAFGVTTPLWDWVFRTLPEPGTSSTLQDH